MNKLLKPIAFVAIMLPLAFALACGGDDEPDDPTGGNGGSNQPSKPAWDITSFVVPLADPYIYVDHNEKKYYIYGTNADNGIKCYSSDDLEHWRSEGLALNMKDSYGSKWFWAPEVYYVEKLKKYVMTYSAEERVCFAFGDSPKGPFVMDPKTPMMPNEGNIDSSIFWDEDGKPYLYFVRWSDQAKGNTIYVAELNDDYKSINMETIKECVHADYNTWETVMPRVTEGPSVFKHDGKYYLLYSANGYTSPDYAVGYATADKPTGPWTKYSGNPVLRRYGALVGCGHGAPFIDLDGKWHYVFHAHKSSTEVHPRNSFIVDMYFKDGGVVALEGKLINPMIVK